MENIEQLFQKYKDDVYRLAVSYTKSRQDAEDVCQTVFLKRMKQTMNLPLLLSQRVVMSLPEKNHTEGIL